MQAYVLAYDADCGPCSAFKSVVGFLDARRRVEPIPLRTADELGLLSRLAPGDKYSSFHLVSREGTWSGSEAILPLLEAVHPAGLVVHRALRRLPGVNTALAFGYGALSRLHESRGCAARR